MTEEVNKSRRENRPPWYVRPARRLWVALLFVMVCLAFAISYAYLQSNFNSITKTACERANDVRKESNNRIFSHVQDEKNLINLLVAITHTRKVEASAWENLNRLILDSTPASRRNTPAFVRYENDIQELVIAYKLARDRDAEIHAAELKVHFDKLPIVDCSKISKSA